MVAAADPFAGLARALAAPGGASSDFDLDADVAAPAGGSLRPAGVLVALDPAVAGVWLTRRSDRLARHPGQVAFPGGKQDAGDADPEAAALREAEEEIGLPRGQVQILGRLPCHETVTGFAVTPVVARLTGRFTPVAEAGEVAEVFALPLSVAADPANYRIEARQRGGQWRRYYVLPYGRHHIWGATARILHGLAARLAE